MKPLLSDLNVNDLLSAAKLAQAEWDAWEAAGEYDRDETWKQLHQNKGDAWGDLYRSISEASAQGPLRFGLKSGPIEVGTVGVLTSTEMMYYSAEVGSKWAYRGVCLRSVESIETA